MNIKDLVDSITDQVQKKLVGRATIVDLEQEITDRKNDVNNLQEQLDNTEDFVFTLQNGTTVTKKVVVKDE